MVQNKWVYRASNPAIMTGNSEQGIFRHGDELLIDNSPIFHEEVMKETQDK